MIKNRKYICDIISCRITLTVDLFLHIQMTTNQSYDDSDTEQILDVVNVGNDI